MAVEGEEVRKMRVEDGRGMKGEELRERIRVEAEVGVRGRSGIVYDGRISEMRRSCG